MNTTPVTPDTAPTPEPVRQPWTPPTLREMNVERATNSGFTTWVPFEGYGYASNLT